MERTSAIAYSAVIAGLALALIAKSSSRNTAGDPGSATPAKRDSSKLSAISPKQKIDASGNKLASGLRETNRRLLIQLDSLRASLATTPEEQGLVKVDAEMLCKQTRFLHASLPAHSIAGSELPMILALTESEESALTDLFENFRTRLHRLERKSIQVLPKPSDDRRAKPGSYTIKIPKQIEGRSELFDEFESQVAELLGDGRDRVASEWLTINPTIGARNSSKEYTFTREPNESIDVRARTLLNSEVFPGTGTPYDGTPGVTPELVESGGTGSGLTIEAADFKSVFGHLIDIDSLPAPEEP